MGDKDARRAAWKNLGDKISQRFWFLDGEILAAKARRRTGLEEFGDPPIEQPLRVLTDSLEREAELHPLGRFLMRIHHRSLEGSRIIALGVVGYNALLAITYGVALRLAQLFWSIVGLLNYVFLAHKIPRVTRGENRT